MEEFSAAATSKASKTFNGTRTWAAGGYPLIYIYLGTYLV